MNRQFFFGVLTILALGACDRETGSVSPTPNRIVNGETVSQKDPIASGIVAIIADRADGQALCTGSILDEETVLTAAHCVDGAPKKLELIFGTDIKGVRPDMTRTADRFVQNSRWTKPTSQGRGDLALIHFSGGLPKGFAPVQLVAKTVELSSGAEVLLAGFGVTDGIQHDGPGILRETVTTIVGQRSSTEIFTDGRKTSVCFGDSGGPAFVRVGNDLVQWGVASAVSDDACNEKSIHTNIQAYLRWIQAASAKVANSK